MMEAVARSKAHWLLGAGRQEDYVGKRPQEDLVTSAVLGTLRFLPPEDRRTALRIALGEAFDLGGFGGEGGDIGIELWPKGLRREAGTPVEPDVLLTCQGRIMVIEVKWHASLSSDQIGKQIRAVRRERGDGSVVSAVMLGDAAVEKIVEGVPCVRHTWRDVSGAIQAASSIDGPAGAWLAAVGAFLMHTDMGRIFNGLRPVTPVSIITPYRFTKPGHPPWLHPASARVAPVRYTFGDDE